MAGTLFIEKLQRTKRELAHQLQEAKHELATSKDELAKLAVERKKAEDEVIQWKSIAAKSKNALKFTNEDMKAFKVEADFKLPFAVLQE